MLDPAATQTDNDKMAKLRSARTRTGRTYSGQALKVPEPGAGQRRMYRLDEAARAYRVSEFTLRKLMKEGRLPYTKLGKLLLIPFDGAEALFNPSK
jgi:excisionase family DNA binding protein